MAHLVFEEDGGDVIRERLESIATALKVPLNTENYHVFDSGQMPDIRLDDVERAAVPQKRIGRDRVDALEEPT